MKGKASTIFIGAGTAALAAGNKFLSSGYSDFLILEKGNSINKRACPGEKEHTCKFCKSGCPVIEGVGGANALHGNKMCYFPASDHVLEYDAPGKKEQIINFLDQFRPFLDSSNIQKDEYVTSKKFYTSDVLDKNEYKNLILTLCTALKDNGNLVENISIISVEKTASNTFELTSDTGMKFECDNLILSGGRSAYQFAKSLYQQLGIQHAPLTQDIGIRIETGKANFSENYYYQVDPKFKFEIDGLGVARTFCAHNQGFVTPVQFGKSFFADGAFGASYTQNNNIALMVRTNEPLSIDNLENWCASVNRMANNQLIVTEIELNNKSNRDIADILSNSISYPTAQHTELMNHLIDKVILSSEYSILKDHFDDTAKLRVYGPAIDRYWNMPTLDENFQSIDVDRFYVIGDAAGKSRGIYQAMYSGVSCAINLLNKATQSIKDDKIWSGRISASV